MKKKTISTDQLLLETIDNKEWENISRKYDLTEEQLDKFKGKIIWFAYLIYHEDQHISLDYLSKWIDEGYINLKDSDIKKFISKRCGDNIEFIKKYKDDLHMGIIFNSKCLTVLQILQFKKLPKVGDGVTISAGSDCYPYTIIDVNKKGTRIKVQSDNSTPAEGYDYYSNQVYNYSPNPNGIIYEASLRRNGQYQIVHTNRKVSTTGRSHYQDPSF